MSRRLASLLAEVPRDRQKAVRLLPAGEFRSADGSGRPSDVPAWRMDAALASAIIQRYAARQSKRVVDFEHQTLNAAANGKPAPAAGWIEVLEWRDDGLYAGISWTNSAAAMMADGQYRYISPVFTYDDTGAVLDILHAGLTNNPGLDGLTDLAALSAAFGITLPPDQETPPMKELLKALGLAATATEAEAVAAVAALNAKAAESETKIAALTAQAGQAPDPAKYVPMSTHAQTQHALAELTAKVEKDEREALLKAGLDDGRILEPQKDYWSKQPLAALKAYLEVAQPVAALTGTQTGGKKPSGDSDAKLSDGQMAMCKQLGVEPKEFLATLTAEA